MVRASQLPTIALLIACLLGSSGSEPLFAAEPGAPSSAVARNSVASSGAEMAGEQHAVTSLEPSHLTFGDDWLTTQWSLGSAGAAVTAGPFTASGQPTLSLSAQRGRGRGRAGRRNAAVGAVILGAAATITGAALLVYANRPDCSANRTLNGCGYGTKVVGGAVLSAGVVGMVAGAIAW